MKCRSLRRRSDTRRCREILGTVCRYVRYTVNARSRAASSHLRVTTRAHPPTVDGTPVKDFLTITY
jgi:hypothetical protein